MSAAIAPKGPLAHVPAGQGLNPAKPHPHLRKKRDSDRQMAGSRVVAGSEECLREALTERRSANRKLLRGNSLHGAASRFQVNHLPRRKDAARRLCVLPVSFIGIDFFSEPCKVFASTPDNRLSPGLGSSSGQSDRERAHFERNLACDKTSRRVVPSSPRPGWKSRRFFLWPRSPMRVWRSC